MGEPWPSLLALFGVGCVAGAVNVVAGGGSFLTLPVMIFLGLPPTVANGTNRVAILVQNAGAVWGFHRHRLVERRWLRVAAAPALLGAAAGTWAAVEIGETAFERVLALLMVAVSLWILWDPLDGMSDEERRDGVAGADADRLQGSDGTDRPSAAARSGTSGENPGFAHPGYLVAFFGVGFYGGFVQAGVGFFVLAVATAGGLDLVRGNALKVLLVLAWTPIALAIFAASGKVAWGMGAALAAGNLTGALFGVRLTVLKGHRWVKRAVTALVIVFAVKLLVGG